MTTLQQPSCRSKWLYAWPYIIVCVLIGICQSLVIISCVSLFFRFILQSCVLWNFFFCVLYGVSWYILDKRLNTECPTRKARIKRVKTIPAQPHPQLQQKTFCWIELVDDDAGAGVGGSGGTVEQAKDLVKRDPEESREEMIQDIRAWSLEHPCIIVAVEEQVQVGDLRTVHLTDGDPTRPFDRPHQRDTRGRMKALITKSAFYCALSLVVLYFLFGGLPVFFASSQDLEDSINGFWDWVDQALPDDDNDGNEEEEEEDPVCQIPPNVAVAYDCLIFLQFLILIIVPLRVYRKTKKFYGMEEPPADSYQLLRGDEDEEDLNDKQGNDNSVGVGPPTTQTVVV